MFKWIKELFHKETTCPHCGRVMHCPSASCSRAQTDARIDKLISEMKEEKDE